MTNEGYITLTPAEIARLDKARQLLLEARTAAPTKALTLIQEAEDLCRSVARAAFWRPL